MNKIQEASLVEYLLNENEQTVLEVARNISVFDLSSKAQKKVVIPTLLNSGILREATLNLLKPEGKERYGLFKVGCFYQTIENGIECLVKDFLSGRASWSARRVVEWPKKLSIKQTVEFARRPNIAECEISVFFDDTICFGDGRAPLIAEEGKRFMEVYSRESTKSFFTLQEIEYISRLQRGQ